MEVITLRVAKGGDLDIEIRGSLSGGEKERRIDTVRGSGRQSQGEADEPSADSLRSWKYDMKGRRNRNTPTLEPES